MGERTKSDGTKPIQNDGDEWDLWDGKKATGGKFQAIGKARKTEGIKVNQG